MVALQKFIHHGLPYTQFTLTGSHYAARDGGVLIPRRLIEWYQELIPSKAKGTRPGYLVWINTLMIGVCVIPVALGLSPRGVNVWYCVTAIAGINATCHIIGVSKLKNTP